MRWFDQHMKVFVVLIGISMSALVVKQGLAIAEYGVGGWLRGDGPSRPSGRSAPSAACS